MAIQPVFFRPYRDVIGHGSPRPAFDSLTGRPLFIDVRMVPADFTVSLSAAATEQRDIFDKIIHPAGSHTHTADFSLSRSNYYDFNTTGAIDEKSTNIGYSETQSAQCYLLSRITISNLNKPYASGLSSTYKFRLVIYFYVEVVIGSSTWRSTSTGSRLFSPADYLTPWTTFSTSSPTSYGGGVLPTLTILSTSIAVSQGSA